MRFVHASALLSILFAFAGMAATPKKTTSGKSVKSAVRKAGAKKATSSGPATGKAAKSKVAKGKKAAAPASTWRTRQQAPTADRYREIQQALVSKGYLKTEPTGVWDGDSINAMQRFQTDQKIPPTGKVNAPSLIGLGLGAKSAGAPEAAPLPGAPARVQPTTPDTQPATPSQPATAP
jgi:hypothetical protein